MNEFSYFYHPFPFERDFIFKEPLSGSSFCNPPVKYYNMSWNFHQVLTNNQQLHWKGAVFQVDLNSLSAWIFITVFVTQ